MVSTSEILENYNKKIDQEDVCPKFGGAHDYEELDKQFISKQLLELDLICLHCSGHKYVYQCIEDSEL